MAYANGRITNEDYEVLHAAAYFQGEWESDAATVADEQNVEQNNQGWDEDEWDEDDR